MSRASRKYNKSWSHICLWNWKHHWDGTMQYLECRSRHPILVSRSIRVECVQTGNGFEFTSRFSNSKHDLSTLFEKTAGKLGIWHKLIPLTRHATTAKWNTVAGESEALLHFPHHSLWIFFLNSSLSTIAIPTTFLCLLGWRSPLAFSVQHV